LQAFVKRFLLWGGVVSIIFIIIYALFGQNILGIFTDNQDVISFAKNYLFWILLIPVTGFIAFLYDGILIGLTESVIMRNAIFISTAAFFLIYFSLSPIMGNNALWLAFLTYLLGRSLLMMIMSKKKIFVKKIK
jgi:MATE family multidrug resistance protein